MLLDQLVQHLEHAWVTLLSLDLTQYTIHLLKARLAELIHIEDFIRITILEPVFRLLQLLAVIQDLLLVELNMLARLICRIIELQDGVDVGTDMVPVENVLHVIEQLLSPSHLSDLGYFLDALDALLL